MNYATVSVLALTNCQMAGLKGDTLTVTQDLDLSDSMFIGPVLLAGAEITGRFKCSGARLDGANADGNALIADNLRVGRDAFFRDGFTAAGAIWLVGGEIAGNLDCSGAKLRANNKRLSLVAERLKVGGAALLGMEFTAIGAIWLLGAEITGNLEFSGAKVAGATADGNALVADNLKVGHSALLRSGFTAAGAIRLFGADITGDLECDGAQLNGANAGGLALVADNLKVGRSALFRNGFTAAGALWLLGAEITGNLECDGAQLNGANAAGLALVADNLKVGRTALLRNGFTAAGAVSLLGAEITGNLECDGAQLNGANAAGLALVADNLKVGRTALLRNGFTAAGAVSLLGAEITGNLECDGAQLNGANAAGLALVADGLKVSHDVFLRNGFTAAGAISLLGAEITGNLECDGAQLNGANAAGLALVADGLKVSHDVFLRNGFTAAGAISLLGAEITGNLECNGAKLNGIDEDSNALLADNLVVGGDLFLDEDFTAAGGITLMAAKISSNLECDGAQLNGANADGLALVADGLKVGHDVFLRNGFTAAGAISLLGAEISGDLDCDGARLDGTNADGYALIGGNLQVGRNAFLRNGFTAAGAIWLLGANISGNLVCDGAQLNGANARGTALLADNLKVGHDAFLRNGFSAAGTVSLESVRIDGSLWLSLRKPPEAKVGTALHAPKMQIVHELRWVPDEQVTGLVNLEDAQVGQLRDDWAGPRGSANGYWPSGGKLVLDGFTYTRLGGDHQATAAQRLTWIQSQYKHEAIMRWGDISHNTARASSPNLGARFATQPYEQLANVYQKAGQDKEARIIALARRRDIRRYGALTWYRKSLNWLLDKTIQYGYQTWRAVFGLALVYVTAVVIFWIAQHHAGLIVPVMNTTSAPEATAMDCISGYPCFYPAGYAIDVVIPIINVHQASYWAPNGHASWGNILTAFTWLATAFGWALATLAVAGYTGLARNTDAI